MSRTGGTILLVVLVGLPRIAFGGMPTFEASQGELRAVGPSVLDPRTFSLTHTAVDVQIVGHVAHAEVTQRFTNPYRRPIEAIYLFPLPHRAAIHAMRARIGDRVIVGVLKSRAEARRLYESAKEEGRSAALLSQERPNIFTQFVGQIQPGESIEVVLSVVGPLALSNRELTFVFPLVVGPRYNGTISETPSVLPGNHRSGRDVAIRVAIDAGFPIAQLSSPSHAVVVSRQGLDRAVVRLARGRQIPNTDFVLRFGAEGRQPRVALHQHHDDRGGFFNLMVLPTKDLRPSQIRPRELIFVVDASGSMAGQPLAACRRLVSRALKTLQPRDTFTIIRFSDSVSFLSKALLDNRPEQIEAGLRFIDATKGRGRTEMVSGIDAALRLPKGRNPRLRIVLFLTDGYIASEEKVLQVVRDRVAENDARIFTFGIGSSVNRHLLAEMSRIGRGSTQVVLPDEFPEMEADRFADRIARPFLTDLEIDWGELQVESVYPQRLPDLFAEQPVVVVGRYREAQEGTIWLRGQLGNEPWSKRIPVRLERDHNIDTEVAIPLLWARARLADLRRQLHGEYAAPVVEPLKDAMVETSLTFGIVTELTSFIAVEEQARSRRRPMKIYVPVDLPRGMSDLSAERRVPTYDTPSIGSLSRNAIGSVIRRSMQSIEVIYERALKRNPTLSGQVDLALTIRSDGTVVQARIARSTLNDPMIERQLVQVASTWRFPPMVGATMEVIYPFVFNSN